MLDTKRTRVIINYLLLFILSIFWGSQFALNEIALKTIPAMTIAAGRTIVGVLTLSLLIALFAKPTIQKNHSTTNPKWPSLWLLYGLICLFEAIIPFFLIPWGQQQHVDSGIAAILTGTVPIFALLFSKIILKESTWQISAVLSIIIGFIGIIVLVLPDVKSGSSILGELAILGASMGFAIGVLLLKNLPVVNPAASIRNILILASIPLTILSLIMDKPWMLHFTWQAIISIILIGAFGSGICYFIYMLLIHRAGTTFATLSGYLVPLVGVIIGVVFLGDSFAIHQLVAIVIIFTALLINQLPFLLNRSG
jgi:drug/metabolite transporter (DMT)-like permease